MATTYPTSVQALASPGSGTYQDDTGFELDVVVTTTNDTVEAVQTKVGIGSSNQSPVASRVLGADGSGTSSWRQVATADLVANAITQATLASSLSGNTTSTSYVDITGAAPSLTTTGGDLLVIAVLCVANSAASNASYFALKLDAASEVGEVVTSAAVNNGQFVQTIVWRFTGVSAASHTVKGRFKVSAGTSTAYSGQILMVEVKK